MSEHICRRCGQIIKLDRKMTSGPGGLTNLSYWCYTDPALELNCFSEDIIKTMKEIKNSGEECHLINWNYTDDYVKILVEREKSPDRGNEKSVELTNNVFFVSLGVALIFLVISYI